MPGRNAPGLAGRSDTHASELREAVPGRGAGGLKGRGRLGGKHVGHWVQCLQSRCRRGRAGKSASPYGSAVETAGRTMKAAGRGVRTGFSQKGTGKKVKCPTPKQGGQGEHGLRINTAGKRQKPSGCTQTHTHTL